MSLSPITIGMLPGWPAYSSGHMDHLIQSIIHNVRATAFKHGCNLLIAGGENRKPGTRSLHTAWPIVSPDCDFIPVGDWNTDGMIIIGPVRSEERSQYVRKVIEEGFPVVFVGPGEGEPAVVVDNNGGIRMAMEHLVKHGHRRIAFIAGDPLDNGDSHLRLQAYHRAIEEFEAVSDPRLIAYGYHFHEGGHKAMEQILSTGIGFTAVVASNDLSAFGAMEMLKAAGRRIPMDVAVIGFDDLPMAAGQIPPLTSVHYPLFDLGVRAANLLIEKIQNPRKDLPPGPPIPTWLAVRESCGCVPAFQTEVLTGFPAKEEADVHSASISLAMLDVLRPNIRQGTQEELADHCRELVDSFFQSVDRNEMQGFQRVLHEVLSEMESGEDHLDIWQEAISILRLKSMKRLSDGRLVFAENLLHQARLAISDAAERQCLRWRLSASGEYHQIGRMTARMFSAGNEKDVLKIFAEHMPDLGVKFEQVFFYEPRQNDPLGGLCYYSNLPATPAAVPDEELQAVCCETRNFPTPETLPNERPFALIFLPLVYGNGPSGFIAFDTGNLDPLANIVRQLAAALKTLKLHIQAEDLSLTDSVTGALNRRFFELLVQRELNRCRRFNRGLTLILIQINGWREYCESSGMSRGKEALCSISRTLKECVRRNSDIICRFTSDTFALLLPETDQEGSRKVAETIRMRVGVLEEVQGKFGIDIGVCVTAAESHCDDVDTLLYCVDRALFRAKSSGQNQTEVISFTAPVNSNPEGKPSLQEG